MNYKKIITFLLLLLSVLLVYREWFFGGLITAGDFWPYFQSMYELRSTMPFAWDPNGGGGMGANSIPFLWIHMNFGIGIDIFGKLLGLNWPIVERLYYLIPLLSLLLGSPYLLFKKLFPDSKFSIFATVIYGFNTYILMVIGGGQLHGVGMAYALVPLIIWALLRTSFTKRSICILSILFSALLLFDIRIFYLSLFLAVGVVIVLRNKLGKSIPYLILVPLAVTLLIHAFWILPLIIYPHNPIENLGSSYGSLDAVRFFSFAQLENSIALLHPNWYENVFGKVGFMKPEFLIIPIIAFASILLIGKEKKHKKIILLFSSIGLIGAFLAKGANEPFGEVYLFMFERFPGFQMFRDPTKFYVLTALSYSILIPYTLESIYIKLRKIKKIFSTGFLVFSGLLFIILLWPAISGQLGGTFKTVNIPNDYVKLENFLRQGKSFYRTLWVPDIQRFAYFTNNRPAVSYDRYKPKLSAENLRRLSIKYVIVPYDVNGEIFVTDRKFDNVKYLKTIEIIEKVDGLFEIDRFGKVKVYEVPDPQPHFWSEKKGLIGNVEVKNPTHYRVDILDAEAGDELVFAESFDAFWFARKTETLDRKIDLSTSLPSNPHQLKLNSFTLREAGNYTLDVFYLKQKYVEVGGMISMGTLITVLVIILGNKIRFKK